MLSPPQQLRRCRQVPGPARPRNELAATCEVVELVEYYAARRISRRLWPTYVKPTDWDHRDWDHTNGCYIERPDTDKIVLMDKTPTVLPRHIPGLLSLISLDRHRADRNALDALGLLSDPGGLVPHAQVIVDLIGDVRRRTFNPAALRVLSILPTAKLVAITPVEPKATSCMDESCMYDWFILVVVPKLPAGALAGSQSAIEELLEHPYWHTRYLAVRLFDPSDTIDPWALPREERARHEAAIARRLDDPDESVRRLALKVHRTENLAKCGDHGDLK